MHMGVYGKLIRVIRWTASVVHSVNRACSGTVERVGWPCMKNPTFHGYGIDITTEPAFYGSACTEQEAVAIASRLSDMVEEEFPGITVYFSHEGGRPVQGPEESVREEIRAWVENNWTAAV